MDTATTRTDITPTDIRGTIVPDTTIVTGPGIVTGEWSTGRPGTAGIISAVTIIAGVKLLDFDSI